MSRRGRGSLLAEIRLVLPMSLGFRMTAGEGGFRADSRCESLAAEKEIRVGLQVLTLPYIRWVSRSIKSLTRLGTQKGAKVDGQLAF